MRFFLAETNIGSDVGGGSVLFIRTGWSWALRLAKRVFETEVAGAKRPWSLEIRFLSFSLSFLNSCGSIPWEIQSDEDAR